MDKQASRKSRNTEVTVTMSSSWFGLSKSRKESTKQNELTNSRDGQDDNVVQYTVGPEPQDEFMTPDSFEDWVHKVALNPVPIDVEFISLSEMMLNDEAQKLFKEALQYYAKLRGVDKSNEYVTNGSLSSPILQLLKESKLVAINDPDKVGKDVCTGKSKIIFGFGVNLNEKRQILELKPCYPGLNACILDLNQDVVSTFVVALCGEMQLYNFTQKLTKGSSDSSSYNEAVCPKDTVVGFGAIIRFGYPMMIRDCPIEYLGCGYDILYGNPLTDDGSLVDPGYRNPIISFTLTQYRGKDKKDPKYASIPGAWIRPLVSCRRSSESTVVKSMKDYQKALAVDSTIGFGTIDDSVKFALSAGYAESASLNLSKSRRLHIQRNYCFLLEAALPVNGQYAFKKSFEIAVALLTPDFRKSVETCNTIRYSMNPDHPDCVKNVQPWMNLFELFGTHFTYNIKIGGRLTELEQVNASKSGKKSNAQVNARADAQVTKRVAAGSVGVDGTNMSNKSNTTNVSFSYVNVLGGSPIGNADDEDEYLAWIHSIPKNPMPIRSQLAPLSKLFRSKALKEAYDDAMEFYVALNGLKNTPEKKENAD
ncbi:MAC Perforin domain containing protein, putative [Babesia ovata]|uniref:MAC Perforin domain containing protein, putative n=1 Tax=Babesia ovata TaxID=189622 RepID=A0A2H6KIB9_9APIC|nr:MAC Perforin domain containing protein, putative [Babesia ovata]GBE62738.1 MAC Perforin domain containing protein, putative [Babesia ovata]